MNIVTHASPVGPLTLVAEGGQLIGCYFENAAPVHAEGGRPAARDAVLELARQELDDFFAGELRRFSVPVAPRGTEFQRLVWKALQGIPYGRTTHYGAIAAEIGRPAAVRAVGAANGRNPICIIIPCHRVIGRDGSLTGFGGGLERKELLLSLERRAAAPAQLSLV